MSFTPSAQAAISLIDSSQIGDARRNAARIAELTALNATERGKVAIIATELATNLVRHSAGGEMIIRRILSATSDGIEFLAIDRGPGMADVSRCLEDGFSTGGTAGQGLGAVRRLSSEFDVQSDRPTGTVIVSRVFSPASSTRFKFETSAVSMPAPGETMCGDNWSVVHRDGIVSVILADGLGHGPLAAAAADEALRVFHSDPFRTPAELMEAMHTALRSTRGAAITVVHANVERRQVKVAGIGNVAASLVHAGGSRGLFSHNGTVGLNIRRIQEFDYDWQEKTLLVVHSDGLQTRWNLSERADLLRRHPAVIAGTLYRDYKRGRDDATVLVIR